MGSTASAGFSRPETNDQRGWLWVVTLLSMIYSATFLGARLFVRHGSLWWDDIVLGVAYLLAAAHWATSMPAVALGLGATLPQSSVSSVTLGNLAFASRILFITSHWVAKVSTFVLTKKIFSGNANNERAVFNAAGLFLLLSGLAAILTASAGCVPDQFVYGQLNALCSVNVVRWAVLCILDALSEICIYAALAIPLEHLKMSAEKKRQVRLMYSARLGVLAFSVAQTATYIQFLHGGRASVGLAPTIALQDLQLCYSLISATVPCLRPFVGAFASPKLSLLDITSLIVIPYRRNESYQPRTAELSEVAAEPGRSKGRLTDGEKECYGIGLIPDTSSYHVGELHGRGEPGRNRRSVSSEGSEQNIIRRDVDIHVASTRILPQVT